MFRTLLLAAALLALAACSKPSNDWHHIARGAGQIIDQP